MQRKPSPGLRRLGDPQGFTLMELMVSMMIIAILATMGIVYLGDVRARSADSQAYTEGRHLLTAVSDALLGGEDVNFGDGSAVTGPIGSQDTGGSARNPIYSVSPDIRVEIDGTNTAAPGDAVVDFYVYSQEGTGKKYYYAINEDTGQLVTADF